MRIINALLALISLIILVSFWQDDFSLYVDLALLDLHGVVIGIQTSALANLFALLIGFSWLMVSLASFASKQSSHPALFRWLPILSFALFLMVYTVDYLLFFIGWEIMSIVTYFILAPTLTPQALIKYVLFAMASALALLMGIVILYSGAETLLYMDANQGFMLLSLEMKIVVTLLMLFAFFIKLGAIGLHYWVVDSYQQADTLFSAYLSAILSKMGLYGVIIFLTQAVDIYSFDATLLTYSIALIGVISSIIATFKAIREDDLKRLLAYSSIAQLGYIVTVLALANGMGGALYHAIIHTLIKLLLFINIASIIALTKRSKVSELGGLIYRTPHSFVMLLIAIIALAGMPPLGGFASKYLIYTSLLDAKMLLILSAVMFASVSGFLYIYKLIYGIYLGHPTHKSLESLQEVSKWYLLPQYIIALLLIIIGTFPALIIPMINSVLCQLHLTSIPYETITTLESPLGAYNGSIIMGAFGAIFVVVLFFLWRVKSKTKEAKDRFDIAYCGEEPTTTTPLHYGYGMTKELQRVSFIATIWHSSSGTFYNALTEILYAFSNRIRKLYTGNLAINFNWIILFAVLLLWWGTQ